MTTGIPQNIVRAVFNDTSPPVNYDNEVRSGSCREAVSYDDGSPFPGDRPTCFEHHSFGRGIERRGRLVEEQKVRVDEFGTGQCDQLALARREPWPRSPTG